MDRITQGLPSAKPWCLVLWWFRPASMWVKTVGLMFKPCLSSCPQLPGFVRVQI